VRGAGRVFAYPTRNLALSPLPLHPLLEASLYRFTRSEGSRRLRSRLMSAASVLATVALLYFISQLLPNSPRGGR